MERIAPFPPMDRLNFRCDAEKRDEQTTAQTGTGRTRMATKALPPISNTGAKKRIRKVFGDIHEVV